MSSAWTNLLAVALGGAAGSVLRHLLGVWLPRAPGAQFSPSILLVNMVGCFLAALALVWVTQRSDADFWRALIITGFMGGLTTFSAYGLDLLLQARDGRWGWVVGIALMHVVLGLAAAGMGWSCGKSLWSAPTTSTPTATGK